MPPPFTAQACLRGGKRDSLMPNTGDADYREWAHAPAHLFVPGVAYMVTSRTYRQAMLFNTGAKRDFLLYALFAELKHWDWRLQAWAVMANHFHFIAHAPDTAKSLKRMMTALHSKTAIWLNKHDETPGRKVWFQYWDTCLTFERSYLARLHYVHANPVKHGLVEIAENYKWCSMGWFLQNADAAFRRTVLSFKYDEISAEE